jgi:hypothetical protein
MDDWRKENHFPDEKRIDGIGAVTYHRRACSYRLQMYHTVSRNSNEFF